MRIEFANTTHPSRVAKSLKKALADNALDFTLSECQQIVARMGGYAGWHELAILAGRRNASPPDALVGVDERAERHRQYLAALVAAGAPDQAARRVVGHVSPTAARVARPAGDYAFMFGEFPGLAKLDLSRDVLAANPGLLNLVRRTHAAAAATPFWAEQAAWTAFRVASPQAADLLEGLRRSAAHSWWGPATMLALARFEAEARRSPLRLTAPFAATGIVEDKGVEGLSAALARMNEGDLLTMVSGMHAGLGVAVLEAAWKAGMLAGLAYDDSNITFHSSIYSPWQNPQPSQLTGPSAADWSNFSPADGHCYNHQVAGEMEGDYAIRVATQPDDEDVVRLLARAVRGPDADESALEFLGKPGGAMVLLGAKSRDGHVPVAGACLQKTVSVEERRTRAELRGLWLANRKAGVEDMLVAAVACELKSDLEGWQEIVAPGAEIALEIASGPWKTDRIADLTCRALEFRHDVDRDNGEMLVYAPTLDRSGARPLCDVGLVVLPKKFAKRAEALSIRHLNMALPQGTPIAVEPRAVDCDIRCRQGYVDTENLHEWSAGCLADLRSQATRKFIAEMGEKAGIESPALVISQQGMLFIMERTDVATVMDGSPDGVWGDVVHVAAGPDAAAAMEFEAMFAVSGASA
jgi:hypothetical protein